MTLNSSHRFIEQIATENSTILVNKEALAIFWNKIGSRSIIKNNQGSVCLPCSWISRSAASCGMETCRTEVSVFDLESITSPLGLRTYCLRTE